MKYHTVNWTSSTNKKNQCKRNETSINRAQKTVEKSSQIKFNRAFPSIWRLEHLIPMLTFKYAKFAQIERSATADNYGVEMWQCIEFWHLKWLLGMPEMEEINILQRWNLLILQLGLFSIMSIGIWNNGT